MGIKNEYSYVTTLDELEALIKRVVVDTDLLSEFNHIFKDARKRKTVPIRGIHEKLMNYRKVTGLHTPFTEAEGEMLRDVLDLWG